MIYDAVRVPVDRLGELRLPGNAIFSSGSGLASVGDSLYVAPDDQLFIGRFPADLHAEGQAVPVLSGPPLPEDTAQRKKVKPDLESLSRVPAAVSGLASDGLLTLGSGSTSARERGVLLPLDGGGQPTVIDLHPLYAALHGLIPGLNIEGVAVTPDVVRLVQRGDSVPSVNAVIDLDPAQFFAAVRAGRPVPAECLRSVRQVDLGSLPSSTGPVPLCFTDITPAPDGGFLFSAAAEQTTNAVDDGNVLGSAIGRLNPDGSVAAQRLLDTDSKIEGIDVDARRQVHLVSDPDDPTRCAELFLVPDPGWLLSGTGPQGVEANAHGR